MFTIRGIPCHVPRAPRRFFEEMSGGEALFPLIVLVGFVLASELDQTAFAVLGPDIRDVVQPLEPAASSRSSRSRLLGGLLLAVPLAYYSDRIAARRASRSSAPRSGPCSASSPRSRSRC